MKEKNILCIDDEEMIRQTIGDFLEDSGYCVFKASNGLEGLDIFNKNKIDIILVDLRMPEMDGLEVLAAIKEISPDMPVIVVSGAALLKDAIQAMRLGAWDYITKPIEDLTLLELTIDKCLDKARLISENKKYKDHLEDIVRERTEQLIKLNKELETAKEKAEEGNRTKNVFLANISHELRTPMNSILGFSNLLSHEKSLTIEQREYAQIIESSSNRLLETINDILYISSLETDRVHINKNETNLNDLLDKLYKNFEKVKIDLGKTTIKIILKKPANSENIFINTDQIKVEQVLKKLLSNALKFTWEGKIETGYRIIEDKIEFFVKDTGIGISDDKQNLIFERFIQLDDGLTRKYEGSGLGLAVAKHIINMMGGKIWVESKENVGSTFYFTIPYEKTDNKPQDKYNNHKLALSNNKITILIVEDDEASYELYSRILKRNNYTVIHAEDGQKGIDICETNPDVDIVLMDIHLPGMDGYEATRKIIQIRNKMPVIAQTAYALDDNKNKCLEAGCVEYMTKPIEEEEMIKLIKKYTGC